MSNHSDYRGISRRRLLKATAMGLGALPLLQACVPAQPPNAPEAGAPAAAAETSASSEPKPGGELLWAQIGDPLELDPQRMHNNTTTEVAQQFYDSLTAYDENANPIPALATSWETPDDNTYIWHLREGVKFHNGQEMTADDVVYTVERMINPDTGSLWVFTYDSIVGAEAVDKYTVKMTTNRPDPSLPGAFAMNRATGIIPAGIAETTDLKFNAVGTGPFRLVEFVPASHVIMERFADYWNSPLPYVDRLTIKVLPEEETRLAALRTQQLDGSPISADGALTLASEPGIQIENAPIYGPYTLEPNCSRAPTNDVRVRQAIALAVDRNAYIENLLGGLGTLTGPIAPGYGDWFIPPDQLGYEYNPEKAKALLAEAGVAPGTELVFPVTAGDAVYVGIGVMTADFLKQVGLEVKVEQVEAGVLSPRFREKDYHLYSRRRAFRPDPDGHLRADFHSTGNSNSGYNNPEVDELLDTARITLDHEERKAMYEKVQRIIIDEAPHIMLMNSMRTNAYQGYVKGFTQRYTGFYETLRNVWLDK